MRNKVEYLGLAVVFANITQEKGLNFRFYLYICKLYKLKTACLKPCNMLMYGLI